jgi:hypothetical protein
MVFRAIPSPDKCTSNTSMYLFFIYNGHVISFSTELKSIKDDVVTFGAPEFLFRDLNRAFLRIHPPSGFKIQFLHRGERYKLQYPRVRKYEQIGTGKLFDGIDAGNVRKSIDETIGWLKNYADGIKIVNFRDAKPDSTEERILSETGKAIFLPSTADFLPKEAPQADSSGQYDPNRVITEDLFKRYLESTGTDPAHLDEEYSRFIKTKFVQGILSDAWIPILFHEYVIGYIHIWNTMKDRGPFNEVILKNAFKIANLFAFSLKANGLFEPHKLPNKPFESKIVDVSASGLLFEHSNTDDSPVMTLDTELITNIVTPKRSVRAISKIVRHFRHKSNDYFGCCFQSMSPEDAQHFFEYIYGKSYSEAEGSLLHSGRL